MLLFGLTSLLVTATARGQDAIAEQFYGSGVHRYFTGDLRAAHADFTAAIQAGTQDPRPYYFRALTYLRLGRPGEAGADLQRGASLEAADINDSYAVGKALERVQGNLRLQLERHRKQARVVAQQRQAQQRRERYAAARRFEAQRVEQAGAMEAAPPRGRSAAASDAAAPNAAASDVDALFRQEARSPFSAGPAGGAGDAGASLAPPAAGPADSFAPPAAADDAPAASPFGAPPAAERLPANGASPFGPPPAGAEAPADSGAGPFGGPPAGQQPPVEQPPAEQPPAELPAADSTNPFGAPLTPATPADSPAAPADDLGANPFGTPLTPVDEPANGADAGNPFGGPPAATATPDMPAANSTPAAGSGQNGATNSSASGGLFRALRRATGIDAAIGAAGGAAKSLPIGGPGPRTAMPSNAAPPTGNTFIMPPGARGAPAGAAPDQPNPFNETPPANVPADASNPFGAPAGASDAGDNPFGANPFGAPPAADMPPDAAAGASPFQDDPVQPEPNPPGNAR